MNTDMSENVLVFEIAVPDHDPVKALTHDRATSLKFVKDGWAAVRAQMKASEADVLRIYSEWEPSAEDKGFIRATFPEARLTWSFTRSVDSDWATAFVKAEETLKKQIAAKARKHQG